MEIEKVTLSKSVLEIQPTLPTNKNAALENAQAFITAYQEKKVTFGHFDNYGIIYSPEHRQFWNDVYTVLIELGGRHYLEPFDWVAWQNEAFSYIMFPEKMKTADLQTLCKLYTFHHRKERFCEGHLGALVADGHAAVIASRLFDLKVM